MTVRTWMGVAIGVLVIALSPSVTHAADPSMQLQPRSSAQNTLALDLLLSPPPGVITKSPLDVSITVGNEPVAAVIDSVMGDVNVPVAMVMFDVSGSMSGERLRAARGAVREFTSQLNDDVLLGLGSFADDVTIAVAPTLDRAVLLEALRQLRARGNTALFDGVREALDVIEPGERVIVISDGADTASRTTLSNLVRDLRGGGRIVDVVSLDSSEPGESALQAIAEASGGSVVAAEDATAIASALGGSVRQTITQVSLQTTVPWNRDIVGTPIVASLTTWDGSIVQGATRVEESMFSATPAIVPTNSWQVPILLAVGVLIAVVSGVTLTVMAIMRMRNRRQLFRVLDSYTGHSTAGADAVALPSAADRMMTSIIPLQWQRNWRRRLDSAELTVSPAKWLLIQTGVACLTALLIVFLPVPLWLAAVGFIAGWLVTEVFIRYRASVNRRRFEADLPEFLTLMASGLRSGLSFGQAISGAAAQGSDALARQMRRATGEVAVGADLADALMGVADRMESEDLRWTVQALRIQQRVGGSLSRILEISSTTVRQRAQLHREVRALSAEGRLSAWILMALPVAIFAFFAITRPEYVSVFWTQPLGWTLLGVLVVILAIGALWMRRVIEVKV
jgi:Flp pilus assembly protein TadB